MNSDLVIVAKGETMIVIMTGRWI